MLLSYDERNADRMVQLFSQKSLLLSVKKDYAFTAFQFCVRMQHKGMIRVRQRYIPVCHTDQRLLLLQPV